MQRTIATAILPLALLAMGASPAPASVTKHPDHLLAGFAKEVKATNLGAKGKPNSLTKLVSEVKIPYHVFTLKNGLRVIVNTDRKAPIVGVTFYYGVGSKNEPSNKTGFAHLYEHLFFGGSENVPNFDIPLRAAGSTQTNGSTSYDRTNYVETVPTGSLNLALFIESDRMGHLLPAVSQQKLDRQRGVVENEKREDDNQPYGLDQYLIGDRLLPVGNPYRHAPIGSNAALNAATLTDVKQWYINHYGPNNAVLALSGDIDVATAKKLVTRWFGNIPRGPAVKPVTAGPVTLPHPVQDKITDKVPQTRIIRAWSGPGMNSPDAAALEVGMDILGGLDSSRLDNALVYGNEDATDVSAGAQMLQQVSFLEAQMDVAPGVNPKQAEKAFKVTIAKFLKTGPTAAEVHRAATSIISGEISGLQQVGEFSGKGAILARGLLYTGHADHYHQRLEQIAALTPAKVRAAMRRWLLRPAYTLMVVPGKRTLKGANLGGWDDPLSPATAQMSLVTEAKPAPVKPVTTVKPGDETAAYKARKAASSKLTPRKAPPVTKVGELTFPTVQHATLSNGIKVTLARRTDIPKVAVALNIAAGNIVDPPSEAGRMTMMINMLDEGTRSLTAQQISRREESLGAAISAEPGLDVSRVYLSSLSDNLPQSLGLMANIVRHPAFRQTAFKRLQKQTLAAIAQAKADPGALANRAIWPLLYGPDSPYAKASTSGDASVIRSLNPQQLAALHAKWFRPDLASITVVGDITMARLLPMLERSFGTWSKPAGPAPQEPLDPKVPPQKRRLVVVNRPGSPQSMVLLGKVLPITGRTPGMEPLALANQVLGGDFLSRLNMDLREKRSWTYGVSSFVTDAAGPRDLFVETPVQTDRTGDSIKVLLQDMAAFPSKRPVDPTELQRVTQGQIRGLPHRYQTNGQVLGALLEDQLLHRPDDYQEKLPDLLRDITAPQIDAAAEKYLQPGNMTIVVVGDRTQIDPQLKKLGMPITYIDAGKL